MYLNATILGQIISFIFFVLFCMRYIWPPINKIIENRQEKIREGLQNAEKAKIELKYAKDSAKKEIKRAKFYAKNIIQNANKESIKILFLAKKEAIKEKEKIIQEALNEIEIKKKCLYEDIKNHIINTTILAAEKIIEESLHNNIHKNIIKNIISKL